MSGHKVVSGLLPRLACTSQVSHYHLALVTVYDDEDGRLVWNIWSSPDSRRFVSIWHQLFGFGYHGEAIFTVCFGIRSNLATRRALMLCHCLPRVLVLRMRAPAALISKKSYDYGESQCHDNHENHQPLPPDAHDVTSFPSSCDSSFGFEVSGA